MQPGHPGWLWRLPPRPNIASHTVGRSNQLEPIVRTTMIKKENCEVQATLLQFTGNVKKFHAWLLPCPMQTWLPEPSRFSSFGVASLLQGQCRALTFQSKLSSKWDCLKIGYIPNYSHLIGIMIINHWV